MLGGLAGAWLWQRSPTRRAVAWVLAVAGPVLLTLATVPWRSTLVLGGFLFSTLLVVIAAAVIGGAWPALTAVALGVLARAIFFLRPLAGPGADLRPNLVSLAGFTAVGAAVAVLIARLAQLAEDQGALRRVATLVAQAAPADELFAAVTEEVGGLAGADYARLARYDCDGSLTSVATWSRTGEQIPVRAPTAVPIIVEGRSWGVMDTGSSVKRVPGPGTEARLASFTDLLAAAIANTTSRASLTRLAEEHAALRRVATLVASGSPPDEVFTAVSEEAGQLLQAAQTAMSRYEPDGTATIVAGWSAAGDTLALGTRLTLGGQNLTTIVSQTCRSARLDNYADASGAYGAAARDERFRSAVGTPIIVQGRLWGVMIAGSVDERPLAPDTEARLASFTELVATAVSNAENLAELTASRARVVAAADETRRRIERDLHDGAQQRLVSLSLALRAAEAAIPPGVGHLGGELANVAEGLVSVVDDLREMARGIHPAILAEGGLARALQTLARRCSVPVELDVRAVARLPERVEVAAYYVISETLTNAAKHANASVIHVGAEAAGRVLHLRVRDDGDGGADPARGSGLVGLKDRVEALGGTITIHSPAGGGTSLHAELPLTN